MSPSPSPSPSQKQEVEIGLMGIDPQLPYQKLNLAGSEEAIPNPASLLKSEVAGGPVSMAGVNAPTFSEPDFAIPPLGANGLAESGIELFSPTQADPLVPDLQAYARPYGLDIRSPEEADPASPDLSLFDRPPDLLMPDLFAPDPLIGDLQHPELEQPTHMLDRPGDMSPTALSMLHDSPDYQRLPDGVTRENDFMLQPGSSTRSRHEATQLLGLQQEEA